MKTFGKLKLLLIIAVLLIPFLALAQQTLPEGERRITNPAPGLFVDFFGRGGNTFPNLILFIIRNVLLPLFGVVAVLFLIVGGFQYITSGANEELAEQGKKTIKNAIIGLVIIILSYVIVVAIINAFVRPT